MKRPVLRKSLFHSKISVGLCAKYGLLPRRRDPGTRPKSDKVVDTVNPAIKFRASSFQTIQFCWLTRRSFSGKCRRVKPVRPAIAPLVNTFFLMCKFLVGVDVVQTVRSLGHVCMCKCTVDVYVKISYLSDLSYIYKCLMPPASPLYYGTVPRCYPSPIWGILQGVHPISSRPELA